MDKKIYVLVPVYNVEKYLKDCIDSVISQTYENWEMILVDDGSKDKSGQICDRYAETDGRIRVIHQKNGGLSKARYTGINAITDAENTYMMFLDSDDLLPVNSLEVLYKTAEENRCDLVAASSEKFISSRYPDLTGGSSSPSVTKIYEHDTIVKDLYYGFFGYGSFSVTLWAKFYRTDYFLKIYSQINDFPFYYGEDLNVTIRLVPEANRVVIIDNTVYFYRYGGGTNRFMKSFVDDCVLLYRVKKEHAAKYGVSDYYKGLIDVEMKNLALQYFIMCRRSKTYPHGKLADEIRYILDIPEFYGAACAISDETLSGDHSEPAGFTPAFVKKDINEIVRIAVQKANEGRLKRFIKNLL